MPFFDRYRKLRNFQIADDPYTIGDLGHFPPTWFPVKPSLSV
jgi:hypothetical protein